MGYAKRILGRYGCAIGVCALCHTSVAAAQRADNAFTQVEGGFGYGMGGPDFRARQGLDVGVLFGKMATGLGRGGAWALHVGAQGWPGTGDSCELTVNGTCRRDFPIFYSVGALVGRAWGRSAGVSSALFVGPSVHRADDGGTALGISGRIQSSVGVWGPVGAVVVAKGSLLPNFRGDVVGLTAFGFGMSLRM